VFLFVQQRETSHYYFKCVTSVNEVNMIIILTRNVFKTILKNKDR